MDPNHIDNCLEEAAGTNARVNRATLAESKEITKYLWVASSSPLVCAAWNANGHRERFPDEISFRKGFSRYSIAMIFIRPIVADKDRP